MFFAAIDMSMMLHLMAITPRESSGKAMGIYWLAEDIGGMIASPTLNTIYKRISSSFSIFFISTVLRVNAAFFCFSGEVRLREG